jgi:4-amino-4-deoxy-L-arabinose transferase-like glycosyltransferase
LPRISLRAVGTVLLIAGICAIPMALYVPFLNEPFMRDEGLYAASAQGLLHGQVPYRDFFDNKPPLIYGWYALSFIVFGQTLWAPRLLVSLLVSLATLCVYLNGRLIYSHRAGLVAAVAFALSIGITKLEINANTEFFMLLPMTINLLAFTQAWRKRSGWWYLVAGVAGGATILTKTVYALPMMFLFAFAVWFSRPRRSWLAVVSPQAWKQPAMMIVGSLIALVIVSLPVVLAGGLPDMIEALTYYSLIYSDAVSTTTRLLVIVTTPVYLVLILGPWALLAAGGAVLTFRGKERPTGILLAGWFVSGVASMCLAGRFYNHYWIAVLPAIALLIPPAVEWIHERWWTRLGRVLLLGVLPISLFVPLSLSLNTYLQPTPAARHQAKYGTNERTDWETQSPALGEWLKEHTSPGDYIYDLGFQGELYFYADRTSPTRFYFDHAFGLDEKYEREAIDELSAHPPVYVVDSARYEKPTPINYYSYPVHEWVVKNYDYVGKIQYADVWRLKGTDE